MQSKGLGKFHSKQFGCKKWLDLLTVNVLNGFYCLQIFKMVPLLASFKIFSANSLN